MASPARKLEAVPDLSEVASEEVKQDLGQFELATINQRVFAIIIDSFLFGIVAGVLTATLTSLKVPGAAGAAVVLQYFAMPMYFILMSFNNGQTLGKKMMKIKVVGANEEMLTIGQCVMRETIGRIASSIFFIGYIVASRRQDRRGWHDMIASTRVVKVNQQ